MTFMVLNLQVLMWSPELRVILMILLAATPSWKIKKQIIEVIEITKKIAWKGYKWFLKGSIDLRLTSSSFFSPWNLTTKSETP